MSGGKSEVLQGTLDLMTLKTLETMGPLHGYGIAKRIEQISQLVLGLKNFSRLDQAPTDNVLLNDCVESSLLIARSVFKDRNRLGPCHARGPLGWLRV